MAFTTPCFILKDTPHLRAELEKLGYEYAVYPDTMQLKTCPHCGGPLNTTILRAGGSKAYEANSTYTTYSHTIKAKWANIFSQSSFLYAINCEDNEEMFLALAALRDDSDIYQLFRVNNSEPRMCLCDSRFDMWPDFATSEPGPRKLTAKEIVAYFNEIAKNLANTEYDYGHNQSNIPREDYQYDSRFIFHSPFTPPAFQTSTWKRLKYVQLVFTGTQEILGK